MGYEYPYRFTMVDKDDINSEFKFCLKPELKSFLFEFRNNFILKRKPEEGVADSIIESGRYDARLFEHGDGDGLLLFFMVRERLIDYWMTTDEAVLLANNAVDFAKRMAANPHLVPIVVDLDVCTVQQEGESLDACMDRAITAQNLFLLRMCKILATAVKCDTMALC